MPALDMYGRCRKCRKKIRLNPTFNVDRELRKVYGGKL
jgi:tRNA(Ile2) C34 agmatinyltransferase TiaS